MTLASPRLDGVGFGLNGLEMEILLGSDLVHFLQKYHPSTSPAKTDEEPVGPYSPLILLPPALCDVTATSVMYIALTLTRFVA